MSLYSENQASPHIIFFHAYDMAKHIMKGYLMYNDNYYPSMAEDDITSAAAYSEYDSEPYTPDEWLNSQETTPILPLPEDGSDWSDQENDFDMQDRAASPMQAMPRRPMPDRPVAPLPDRPGRPDRPVLLCPTDPDGLTGPFRPDPPRQDPFRPYAQTGPGTGVQSCQALFFLSLPPASDSTMLRSADRFRST